ncbi:hypothetical protein NVP1081O_085 [Vibrio phage 1.081.O._10N.286.52.C2]|nr:hypothetical protein NVP1081O_085 [Vibrio phage 1.081.O._10N.286.52.C2]
MTNLKAKATTMTPEQIAAHFDMTVMSNGFQAIDKNNRMHFLSDLRSQLRKASSKKANKKAVLPTAQENIMRLNADFSEYNWFIRDTQPGLDIEKLGLRLYFIGGVNVHQLNIRSTLFSTKELNKMFESNKVLKNHTGKGSVTIGSLSYDEVVHITNKIIFESKEMQ